MNIRIAEPCNWKMQGSFRRDVGTKRQDRQQRFKITIELTLGCMARNSGLRVICTATKEMSKSCTVKTVFNVGKNEEMNEDDNFGDCHHEQTLPKFKSMQSPTSKRQPVLSSLSQAVGLVQDTKQVKP